MHWINVVALAILLMSGLQIFNAYPELYWGKSSYSGGPPLLRLHAEQAPDGSRLASRKSRAENFIHRGAWVFERPLRRAYRPWVPPRGSPFPVLNGWRLGGAGIFLGLIFVINGPAYVGYSILSHHLSRDLEPTRRDWRSIGRSIIDHLHFRHPVGDDASAITCCRS